MTNDPPVLTAHAVETVVFDQARFGARGYNEDQVDDFLDLVVDTIRTLTGQLEEQRREIDRLKHWRQHAVPVDSAAESWEQEARARAESIVAAARVSAEEIRRLAVTNALRLEEETRERARGLLEHTPPPANRHHRPAEPDPVAAPVAEIVDRLHLLRDGLSDELARLEDVLGAARRL